MMQAFLSGLMITGGLIMAIGAQNTFVLKQGLLKQHIGLVVSICWLCDVLLIGAGVYGVGALLANSPHAAAALALAGGLFLLVYGLNSARSAWQGNKQLNAPDSDESQHTAFKVILTTLALTLLNPHAYVDAVMLIGGSAASLSDDGKQLFLAGSLLASALWFLTIGYGSRLLLPLFRRARTWQILDSLIAMMMLYLAYGLFRQAASTFLA